MGDVSGGNGSILRTLERVLASGHFDGADRQKKFLRFVVQKTLQGQAGDLKEYVLALEVFERPPSFNPRTDSIVRVEARKLRDNLKRYYQREGLEDPVRISMPKGSYVPIFETVRTEQRQPAKRRLASLVLGGMVVLLLIGGGMWLWAHKGSNHAGPPPVESIAVLPFANLSQDKENEYFSDGLTTELISALMKRDHPRVVGSTSVFQFKGKAQDIRRVGAQLGAQAVVEGSVRKSGDRLRITAELVEVSSGLHLWSQTYDRQWKDVLAVEEEIAGDIAAALEVRLDGLQHSPSNTCAENLEAYELYLRGIHAEIGRGAQDLTESLNYFAKAAALEPHCAPIYAHLAGSYLLQGIYGVKPPGEVMPKAKEAAKKAIEIDDTLALGHASLGATLALYDWEPSAAEREFQRAIQVNVASAESHKWYSEFVLAPSHRFDQALAEIQKAKWLDPPSLVISTGEQGILYFAGQYDASIAEARRTLEREPGYWPAYLRLAWSFEQKKMFPEAGDALANAMRLSKGNMFPKWELGILNAMTGRKEEARRIIREFAARSKTSYVPPTVFAQIYSVLDEKEEAFRWLGRAREERSPTLVFASVAHAFDNLHDDPRFTAARCRCQTLI